VTYILYTIDWKKSIEPMFRTHFRMYNLFTQFNSFFVYFCHFSDISNNAESPSLFYVNKKQYGTSICCFGSFDVPYSI